MINTTHGPKEEQDLARTLGFIENSTEFITWVEWRMSGHPGIGCEICDQMQQQNPMFAPIDGVVLVKRSVYVNAKEPSVIAEALVGDVNG